MVLKKQKYLDNFVWFAILVKNENVYLDKTNKDWRFFLMAKNTDILLRNQVIYSVYVRNHTPEGTFRAVIGDLDRIKALGTDIVWFLPIHPIGIQGKKGTLGCPYANGTIELSILTTAPWRISKPWWMSFTSGE